MTKPTIQDLSPEVLEQILSFLDYNSIVQAAQVCLQWQLLCLGIAKTLCCNQIPSDVFVEIWEELGLQIPIDFLKVWTAWMQSQILSEPVASTSSSLLLKELSSSFSGAWTPHSHGHQLIRSTCAVRGSFLYIGDAAGTLSFHDVLRPEFRLEQNIGDGAVREIEIWNAENIIAVSGDSKVHLFDLDTFDKITLEKDIKSGENKHLSAFGDTISLSEKSLEITGYQTQGSKKDLLLTPVFQVLLTKPAIQWKLWLDKVTVLEVGGEISVYRRKGSEVVQVIRTEPNMMIMYKNPCFLFRDILFCSTSASVGLIVRTSYWLLGWALEKDEGKLTRALDQDKLNPADDVWCLSLKRNILLCGTEGGCLVVFTCNKTELLEENMLQQFDLDFQMKRGHSKIELEFDKYRTPAFKKMVTKKPILSVDIGFSGDKILLYYRTDIQNLSCLILKNDVRFS